MIFGTSLTQRIHTGKRGWIPSDGRWMTPNGIRAIAAYRVIALVHFPDNLRSRQYNILRAAGPTQISSWKPVYRPRRVAKWPSTIAVLKEPSAPIAICVNAA